MKRKFIERVIIYWGGDIEKYILGACPRCQQDLVLFTGILSIPTDVICDDCLTESLQSAGY